MGKGWEGGEVRAGMCGQGEGVEFGGEVGRNGRRSGKGIYEEECGEWDLGNLLIAVCLQVEMRWSLVGLWSLCCWY